MRKQTKISVCMLTHNHEKFVSDAITGVLMQEVDAYVELVIGDDYSTDHTVTIIKQFQQKYPSRIKLIERYYNVGMMVNFTDVLRSCNGDYVAICEGDDYWIDPKKLAKQINFLAKEKSVDIVFTNSKIFNQSEGRFYPSWAKIESNLFNIEDLLKCNFITTCTVLFRNKLNKKLLDSLLSFRIGDWPLYLLLLSESNNNIYYINQKTAVYREHIGGSYSTLSSEKRIHCVISVYEELLKLENFNKYQNLIYRRISSLFYFLGSKSLTSTEACCYFTKAIQLGNIGNLKYPIFSIVRYIQRSLIIKLKLLFNTFENSASS